MTRVSIVGIALLALLGFLSVVPRPYAKGRFATQGLTHDVLHAAVFCLVFLLIAAGSPTARKAVGVAFLVVIVAAALEILQAARYGVPIEYRDICADAAGVLFGCLSRSVWLNGRRVD